MDTMFNRAPASGWRTMAMVEVDGAADALDAVLADVRHDCRLHPAPSSPDEKPRFYIVADASRGQAHALRSVGLLLFALDAIARSGEFRGFRIIAAEERLLAGVAMQRDSVPMARSKTVGETTARADLRSAAPA
jgi:hypothetical protein